MFTEADHSPSMLKGKQAPLPEKICELTGVQHGGGERLAGTDSCLGCIITGSGAEVLELLLEAKNSRKVDLLSQIVQARDQNSWRLTHIFQTLWWFLSVGFMN